MSEFKVIKHDNTDDATSYTVEATAGDAYAYLAGADRTPWQFWDKAEAEACALAANAGRFADFTVVEGRFDPCLYDED